MSEASEWLQRARSNLEVAKKIEKTDFVQNGGGIFIEEICFELQQAVEKSLKALMVEKRIQIAKTHNISDLIARLEQGNINVPPEIKQARLMTNYAVMTRYPHYDESLTEEDYSEALEITKNVYNWVKGLLNG
jgi:HEPN domain-containing protein